MQSLDLEPKAVLRTMEIGATDYICYDVFVHIAENLDSLSLYQLTKTNKTFFQFGEQLAKKHPDMFTLFFIHKNIKVNMPIQDDVYYSGQTLILCKNPQTKKKWKEEIRDSNALEQFHTINFEKDENWLLRYRFMAGLNKLNMSEYVFRDDYNIFYHILTNREAINLRDKLLHW